MKQCLKKRINQCRVVLTKRTSFQAGSLNERINDFSLYENLLLLENHLGYDMALCL
jgi:hypothetical protein